MLKLDHLTVIAPSLERGVEHVHRQIGIAMPIGGKHPEMGTDNHVLRLGDDVFLEVIAIDPGAQRPNCPRWFGLDAAAEVEGRHCDACRGAQTPIAAGGTAPI